MEIVVLVNNPRVLNHKIENAICHRAVTRKELDFLCSKVAPLCVLLEYTDDISLEWVDTYDYPVILVANEPVPMALSCPVLSPESCELATIEKLLQVDTVTEPGIAQEIYDQLKADMTHLEQENDKLKVEHEHLNTLIEQEYKAQIEALTHALETAEATIKEQQDVQEQDSASREVLQEQMNHTQTDNAHLQEQLDQVQEEKDHLQDQLNQSQEDCGQMQDQLTQNQEEKGQVQEQLTHLQEEKVQLEEQLTTVQGDNERLHTEVTTVTANHALMEQSCNQIKEEKTLCDKEIDLQNSAYTQLVALFNTTCSELVGEQEKVVVLAEDTLRVKEQLDAIGIEKENLLVNVQELKTSLESLKADYDGVIDHNIQLANNVDDLKSEMTKHDNEHEVEINTKIIAYNDLQAMYDSLQIDYGKLKSDFDHSQGKLQDVNALLLKVETLEAREIQLNERLEELIRDKQMATTMINNKTELIDQLGKQISVLQNTVESINIAHMNTKQLNATKITEPKSLIRQYNSKAKIINCFGTGSYGVTSIVFSLADVLRNKRVLVVDMDIVAPSLDCWFQQNPVCPAIDATEESRKTGICVLFERGAKYVNMNFDKIVKPITNNLYYFSGVYVPFIRDQIYATDFDEFLNGIGAQFDYVLFDCGRLGSSIETDSIIKTIAQVAHKNIVVGLNDVFNVRNASIRLGNMQVLNRNAVWVLNLSNTTIVANTTLNFTSGGKTIILPKDMQLYGQKRSLNGVPLLKSKIKEIYDLIR